MRIDIKDRENRLAVRLDEIRAWLRQAEPSRLAQNSGSNLDGCRFAFRMWGKDVIVPFPELVAHNAHTGRELALVDQGIIAYYFYTADGTRPSGKWISFSELPEGRFYFQAFQGYTGRKLAQVFGNDEDRFAHFALSIGGQPYPFGDLAFRFQALPLVPILVTCWFGDEDISPAYRILFDEQVKHHLPADGCAILGSRLTSMLLNVNMIPKMA